MSGNLRRPARALVGTRAPRMGCALLVLRGGFLEFSSDAFGARPIEWRKKRQRDLSTNLPAWPLEVGAWPGHAILAGANFPLQASISPPLGRLRLPHATNGVLARWSTVKVKLHFFTLSPLRKRMRKLRAVTCRKRSACASGRGERNNHFQPWLAENVLQ